RAPGRRTRSSRPARASEAAAGRAPPLGGSGQGAGRGQDLTHEAACAVGKALAPREAAAMARHVRERELELRLELLADSNPHAVATALACPSRVERALGAEVFTLGMRGHEVVEPSSDFVVVTAAEHGRLSAFVVPARQALLAAFLVHERGLAAFLAEVAHPALGASRGR